MRKLIPLLCALWLVSCVNTQKVMDSWIGRSKQELMMKWGLPDKMGSDGSTGEILVYAKQIYIPQNGLNYYDYKMFYINNESKVYYWMAKREQIPPTQIDLNVYKRY